jgi:hypothetical protein
MRPKPLAVGILIICSLIAAPSAASAARRAFDVKVQSVENQDYLVSPDALQLSYKIKNVGTKHVVSVFAKLKIFRLAGTLPSASPVYSERINLPVLTAPESRNDTVDDTVRLNSPLGRYRPQVCVKFGKDKKKGNNCKNGPDFSVIPGAWRGVASFTTGLGSGAVEEFAETAPDATFFFDQHTQEGFQYLGTGRVRYGTSGTDISGCVHSGSGTFDVPSDSVLVLSEDLLSYRVDGLRPQSHTFQAFTDCPPPLFDGPYTAPLLVPAWIQTGQQAKADDATTLSGIYAPSLGFFGLEWAWNFTAQ